MKNRVFHVFLTPRVRVEGTILCFQETVKDQKGVKMPVMCMKDQLADLLNLGVLFGTYRISIDDVNETNFLKARVCLVEFIEELDPQLLINWVSSFEPMSEYGAIVNFEEVLFDVKTEKQRIESPCRIPYNLANSIVTHVLHIDSEAAADILEDILPKDGIIESTQEFSSFWNYITTVMEVNSKNIKERKDNETFNKRNTSKI